MINVRYARGGELDQELGQAVEYPNPGDVGLEWQKVAQELIFIWQQQYFYKSGDGVLVLRVRIRPTSVLFRLAHSFEHVISHALFEFPVRGLFRADRPRADESLVEQVFIVARRSFFAIHQAFFRVIQLPPATNSAAPKHRHFGKHIDAGADILGPLAVMSGSGKHGMRPCLRALLGFAMKLRRDDAEYAGVSSDVV